MRTPPLLAVLMAAATGCVSPAALARGGRAQLRDREGLCSKAATPGYGWTGGNQITTCAQMGSPGTLDDDPTKPMLTTRVDGAANSPSANTGNWQMEAFRDGVLLWKGLLTRHMSLN